MFELDIQNYYKNYPNLTHDENVGVITNYVTEQMLSSDFNTITIPNENYERTLQKYKIRTLFIEYDIYEVDHPWFEKEIVSIINHFNNKGVNIIIVSMIDDILPYEIQKFPEFIIDYQAHQASYKNNKLTIPLCLNETLFNPQDNKFDTDILYFKAGNLKHYDELVEFHEKFQPVIKESTATRISRELIKRLLLTIKESKIFYIYESHGLNNTLYKFLEIASILQNTVVFSERKNNNSQYSILFNDAQQTVDYIRALLNNRLFWDKHIIKKTREAFLKYTFILNENIITTLSGSKEKLQVKKNKIDISVIVTTKRSENLTNLVNDLNIQQNVNMQVILLTHGYILDEKSKLILYNQADFELLILSESEDVSFGNCLNECINHVKYDYVLKMDDDDYYFSNFIIDIYLGIKYSGATLAGKNAFFFYLEEDNVVGERRMDFQFKDVKEIKGNTLLCRTATLKEYKFGDLYRHVDSDLIIRLREDGKRIYSIHPYDMCVYRAADKTGHTFQVNDSRFLKDARILYYGHPNKTVSTD
ncbi:hypothetical protein [Salinicoccus sp. Marseille-QA3877]